MRQIASEELLCTSATALIMADRYRGRHDHVAHVGFRAVVFIVIVALVLVLRSRLWRCDPSLAFFTKLDPAANCIGFVRKLYSRTLPWNCPPPRSD